MELQVLGAATAALVRVEVSNQDQRPHQLVLRCEEPDWGENRGWVDPSQWTSDVLLAGWRDRADRVLLLGLGADAYSLAADGRAAGAKTLVLVWNLKPAERRSGWLVRPYRANFADVTSLRKEDWGRQWENARREWHGLLDRACQVSIPDQGVANAFRACLADLFIMREPVAGGYIAAVPGTETYRAPMPSRRRSSRWRWTRSGSTTFRPRATRCAWTCRSRTAIGTIPKGWGHLMWAVPGFKAWAAMEHYYLTRDRKYLESLYPRLVASSRWQQRQRPRTRRPTAPSDRWDTA